ncbi:serine/threonine protein kinase [Acrocarpospora corrugata]|nr:serine/threonine-protein kinase [Acrocarpospora corrugata]
MPEIVSLRSGDPHNLGAYRLQGRIGEGGQGVVYLGVGSTGDQVAVKLLRSDLAGDPMMRERFLREVDAAKRVSPFCTAQLIETGVAGDQPYIVSEYIEGPTLQQRVLASGPLSGPALHRLAIGTATALAAIHQAGVVHRDFKPANVIMGPDGPRVIDFGIAKALDASSTQTSRPVGTPAYMAPEQIMGHQVGPPADLFAWACTILYAATGNSPFGSDTLPAVINRILNADASTDALHGLLRDVVESCIAKDPRGRPTAEQVLLRLLQHSQPNATILQEAAAAAGSAAPPGYGAPPQNHWAPPGTQPPPPYAPTKQYAAGVPPQTGSYGMPPMNQPMNQPQNQPLRPPVNQPPPPPYHPQPIHQMGTQVAAGPKGSRVGLAVLAVGVAVVAIVAVVVVAMRNDDGGTDQASTFSSVSASPAASSPEPEPSPSPTATVVRTKLPGLSAYLYEASTDPLALTYYDVSDSKQDWTNYPRESRDGKFTRSKKYWQQYLSPDGVYAVGRPRNYLTDDFHGVDIITRATGAVQSLKTVKLPLTYEYGEWSRNSNRVLFTILNPSGEDWTVKGFLVIEPATGKVTIRRINDPAIKDGRFYWSPDESGFVTSYTDETTSGLRHYNFAGEVVKTIPGVGVPNNSAGGLYSPSGDLFVTKCPDASAGTCIWDSETGAAQTQFTSDCNRVLGWWDEQHVYCWISPTDKSSNVSVVDLNGDVVRKLIETSDVKSLSPYYSRTGNS